MAPRRRDLNAETKSIFVNRDGPLARIDEACASIAADTCSLLVFHGPGGQGKTALREKAFDRLEDRNVKGAALRFRPAVVNLHGSPTSDPDMLLVWVRNAFAKAGVGFPAFDLSFAVTWEGTRPEQPFPNLENPWLARTRELIGDGARDTVTTVREVVEESAETIPLLGPLMTRGANWVFDRSRRAWLNHTRAYLQQLYKNGELKNADVLSDLMPWMLAQDLNFHLANNPDDRFVLLVDEYERVFDKGGAGKRFDENKFDEFMRSFVAETSGLLAIFFTREPLPWGEDPDWSEDLEGRQHRVEGLSDSFAQSWLDLAGVDDACSAVMIEGAREERRADSPVYPLLLNLQIEHWLEIKGRGETPEPEQFSVDDHTFSGRCQTLLKRLLRDYGEEWERTLLRLSVAFRFDEAAFDDVVDTFDTGLAKDAFETLRSLSFITRHDDGYISIHRAISDALLTSLSEDDKYASRQTLFENFEARARPHPSREIDSAHLAALIEAAALRLDQGANGYADWLAEIIEPFRAATWSRSGEKLWRAALADLKKSLGEENPVYRKGLEISARALGEEHPDTAASYNNVASNFNAQGRYEEAEPLFRKGLEIRARVLGEEHPDTAASYNNLASSLSAQGRYGEAEPLFRKSLEIWARALGEEHPDTAASYNNVASNLNAQGRYEEAELLFRKGLEIRARVLGEEHPSTAASYNNVASNLDDQGRYEEAEPLFRKSLEIRARTLGEDHPSTADSDNNVASNLNAQGRYEEAEPLFRKAVATMEAAVGSDHPNSRILRRNLEEFLAARRGR